LEVGIKKVKFDVGIKKVKFDVGINNVKFDVGINKVKYSMKQKNNEKENFKKEKYTQPRLQ
jgi:hypothetical protein